MGRRYSRSPSPSPRVSAGDTEAQVHGAAIEAVAKTSPLASWSAIFAMIAGRKIFVGHLGNLVLLRTSICHVTITLAEAKYQMDGQVLLGRELTVVFAEENRKKPSEMRARERIRRRSSSLCYSRSPRYRHSYSPSPRDARAYSRSPDYYSPSSRRRHDSRSISPRGRHYRERSYSRSPYGPRSWSRSPVRRNRSRSWSQSPRRSRESY
ncbi:UNVERIFIED_CONTAM: Serine/arginine-rich SC35-like splicing factor SCL30A [Sesamum latifolium]|uniref:Serine/arginine-rich SC35-like splicing factor SCL30A n=1 Tax=Sesamum latifolium TaxID=2727402 RepID=A0AAW2VGP9_9LAMI